MTEEIIINDVDVAGCEYISDIDCSCIFVKNYYGTTTNPRCSQVKNCHYKRLKRLEQENKKLKEEKQTIKSYLGIDSKTILERLEELDEWKHNDKLLLWKYRSALEEIRAILNKECGIISNAKVVGIINEVLGNEGN